MCQVRFPLCLPHLCLICCRPDTVTPPQNHIRVCVGPTGCPSLCAALIYPISGFPENPQISVKLNQPSTQLHQAARAYSVLLHKSHCNLRCVIIGFRCPPHSRVGQAIWNIWCGRKIANSFRCLCHSWDFSFFLLVKACARLHELETFRCALALNYSSLWLKVHSGSRTSSSPVLSVQHVM